MTFQVINERRDSRLTTRHSQDLGSATDGLNQISHVARPIRSITQILIVTRHQYGISALVSQTCPVSFNPDWLMQSLLCVQNKSGQFLKALSFLQSLARKQFVRVRLVEKTFIHFFISIVFVRGVREFQALLDACSSTREWETFYLTLNIGCVNKTHTHIHTVEPKTLYFKFV